MMYISFVVVLCSSKLPSILFFLRLMSGSSPYMVFLVPSTVNTNSKCNSILTLLISMHGLCLVWFGSLHLCIPMLS